MSVIIINNILLKQYDNTYYVSENGDVYSTYSKKFIKHNIDHDGYHRVDIHSKHIKVHRLVYLVWIGKIPEGKQVNHIDDNKDNNHYTNLYAGTQKQNIKDCIKNGHRKGNINYLTIYDNKTDKTVTFCPANKFIEYCNHSSKNGSVKKFFNKNWFKKRYTIIDYGKGCID